ncbi:MAG: flagellar assembly peptidoglycan hydrolase FlgJ [Candidatus Accumulibacter sp.]|jgi:flagellar protein FlgJ|nr:flagellar assembly peptidoglycan hydrolase FlgJ [Accumulibacter sp.]
MKTDTLTPPSFVLDTRTTSDLRRKLNEDPQAGIRQATQQFEGLLLQMMLKSMRSATPQDGLLDSDQTRFFTEIFDQQLAHDLASRDVLGFGKMIEQQMGGSASDTLRESSEALNTALLRVQQGVFERQAASSAGALAGSAPANVAGSASADAAGSGREYVHRILPHAVDAAKTLDVPPHFLVAHSALESGWGKNEIRLADGSPSYNVFGVKAGSGWQGPTVEVPTTEYVDGAARTAREKFRVYGSYGEAFQDYAKMLRGNSRFSEVPGQRDGAQFARSLQQAGYATDPDYADKLGRVIGGSTLRQALLG